MKAKLIGVVTMFPRSLLAIIFTFTATTALAHGPDQHVLGIVTAIDQKRLEIKTQKGAIMEVQLNKQTRFKENGNPKGTNLPAVGDRVVVETVKDNNVLTATEVHFSAAKKVMQESAQQSTTASTQPVPPVAPKP